MHALFEAREVIDHLRTLKPAGKGYDLATLRVGFALMCLAGTPAARSSSCVSSFRRLEQANDAGLLQVFFDQNGDCRGYAILAFFDRETDMRARSDPSVLNQTDRHLTGDQAWLIAVSGSSGQGWAIARHLRDNFLLEHNRVSYLRRLNGKLFLKSLVRGGAGSFGLRSEPQLPTKEVRFPQVPVTAYQAEALHHYARLQCAVDRGCQDFASIMPRFNHAIALAQCSFDQFEHPRSFISWAMLGEETIKRIERDQTGQLCPGDWRSGTIPCIIEELGEAIPARKHLQAWRKRFSTRNPLRMTFSSALEKVEFTPVG